jgi:hypothetical protein
MGANDRIADFETWSRGRGFVARDVDRKRIVRDLFEIAGPGPISREHVELLVKRFREGLLGAHKVLLARRVGEEVLSWQEESSGGDEAVAERSLEIDDRREEGSEARAAARPRPVSSAPPERSSARPPPKPDAFELGCDEVPEPPPIPGFPRSVGASSSDRPARKSDRPDPGSDPPRREPARALASERPWSEPPGGISDRPRSISDRPDAFSDRPRALSDRPELDRGGESARPRALRGESKAPPPLGDDFALDDEPKKYQPGRSKAPSMRPPGSAPLPEVEADDRGIDPERRRRSDDISDSMAPPPASKTVPLYPIGDVVEERGFSLSNYVSPKFLVGVGGVILVLLLMLTLVFRPDFLFGDHQARVSGVFTSKQLGATIDFKDQWLHAEDLDGDEKRGGWVRNVAQFYRGGEDFHQAPARLTFVVFESNTAIATDEDARTLGASETLNMAQRRKCEPFEYEGKRGTQCFAVSGQIGRAFGVVETYYADAGKVVFSRAMIEMPGAVGFSADFNEQAQQQQSFERQLAAAFREVEDVVFSLKIVPR